MEHFLATMKLMQARWLVEEHEGGPSYAEQADAFLARMAADDVPAAIVEAMRRFLSQNGK